MSKVAVKTFIMLQVVSISILNVYVIVVPTKISNDFQHQ